MSIIELLVPTIIGLTIGFTSSANSTDEPTHIQTLGTIVAAIIITYPIIIVAYIFT